jgi:predicted DNA-binding transcriptional regulator AlpA
VKVDDAMLLTERALGRYLDVSPRTLQLWRLQGRGPKAIYLSGHKGVRYPGSEVRKWIAEQTGGDP